MVYELPHSLVPSGVLSQKVINSKVNQMRSQDLKFRLKNRMFDVDRLRAVESKKSLKQKLKKQSKSETL